ncbi:unnamed protein product [Blepharisma stoltei]|uniref:Uncharacterized protein n=1 Tax=Blepharisma stoltei TaxID=1481888 RepID=A0AAU9IAR5_9CILI|nr:unnamed protein product [Blepharisma stoltei]
MYEPSETFVLTQINQEQPNSAHTIRRAITRLPKLSLIARQKTASPESSRISSSKSTRLRSKSNMRAQSYGNQSTNQLLQTIDQSVTERLGNLYSNPKELVETIKKLEKSKSSQDFTCTLGNDVEYKKRALNKLFFLKKLKEDELKSLKLQIITNLTMAKEGERMENIVEDLKAKIETAREDYNETALIKASLNYMISQRQNSIKNIKETIRKLKEEKEEVIIKIQEYTAERRRYEAYTRKVGLKAERFVENSKEKKEIATNKKDNFISEYEEKKLIEEFLKKQQVQNGIKNKVNEKEMQIQELENDLEKVNDQEQLEAEFNSCLNYIKRQDLVFSQLKKHAKVNSIEEISEYYSQLKETAAALNSSKADLESKIENKRKELEQLKGTCNITKLNCWVEPKIDYESQILKKIEDTERHRELTIERIKRQEYLLSQLSGILTRLLYQVQGDVTLHDFIPSNLPIALEKFKSKTIEMFEYIDQDSTVYQPTKSDISKDNSVTIDLRHIN